MRKHHTSSGMALIFNRNPDLMYKQTSKINSYCKLGAGCNRGSKQLAVIDHRVKQLGNMPPNKPAPGHHQQQSSDRTQKRKPTPIDSTRSAGVHGTGWRCWVVKRGFRRLLCKRGAVDERGVVSLAHRCSTTAGRGGAPARPALRRRASGARRARCGPPDRRHPPPRLRPAAAPMHMSSVNFRARGSRPRWGCAEDRARRRPMLMPCW